jgi:RNA-directed DNA polymerase
VAVEEVVNEVLGSLWLEKHPEKTFIGRIERGFGFLGYHFSPHGLTVAKETLKRFVERATRLYEQEPGEPCGSSRLGLYVERWLRWVTAGISELADRLQRPLCCDALHHMGLT